MLRADTNQEEAENENADSGVKVTRREDLKSKSKSVVFGAQDKTKLKALGLIAHHLQPEAIESTVRLLESKNGRKPELCSDHIRSILEHLEDLDVRFTICDVTLANYEFFFRQRIYPILLRVYSILKVSPKTLLTAAFLFFKHVSVRIIEKPSLRKFTIAAYIFIAAKFAEIESPMLSDIIVIAYAKADGTISNSRSMQERKSRAIQIEYVILEEIEYEVATPHLFEYIDLMLYFGCTESTLKPYIVKTFLDSFLYNPHKIFSEQHGLKVSASGIVSHALESFKKRTFEN